MEEQAYRQQFQLENGHWWFEGRRAVMWALLGRAGLADGVGTSGEGVGTSGEGVRMLDAGCGTGRNLQEFGRLGTATGIDPAPEAIAFCHQRGIQRVTQGTIERLEFADGSFDLLLATDVLEHLRDDRAALRELRRVAAPGATLLCTVPAYRWLWSGHDDEHHHFRRYTLRELRAALRASGWRPLAESYFNSLLLPPIAAVRLLARRRPRDAEGARPDLRLTPPALNGLLATPMRAEAALIGRGFRLPAGVSIGVVARAAESP